MSFINKLGLDAELSHSKLMPKVCRTGDSNGRRQARVYGSDHKSYQVKYTRRVDSVP